MLLSKKKIVLSGILFIVFVAIAIVYFILFAAPQRGAKQKTFIVPLSTTTSESISKLKSDSFIKSEWALRLILALKHHTDIAAGGYTISKSMNAWQIANVLAQSPSMKWVVIPEGLRKEEIADILSTTLGWSQEEKTKWITTDTTTQADYTEGVYFPDTYLIPVDEPPPQVADRLRAKFNEKFAPFLQETLKQNIRWVTLVKLASIIQREAAGKSDMPLVAGILWNRLLQGIKLEVDSTLQYARGDTGKGWWTPITVADKQIDSPYNTYLYKGLPPHPIANPGLDAIQAALYPAKTDCLYYLHDNSGTIHCAKTYAEHQKNIEQYLK